MNHSKKEIIPYASVGLAVLATLIWSGNFVIARAVHDKIGPVSLAFFRWSLASLIMLPFGLKQVVAQRKIIRKNAAYLFWAALTGISLFNTCIYISGKYTPAIKIALIGTTSSPIMAVILARIFLKESVNIIRAIGIILCISGIFLLLGQGDFRRVLQLHFELGDMWILLGAFFFAIYNVLVRRKPRDLNPIVFLTVLFVAGSLLLFPFFLIEWREQPPISWSWNLICVIVYLGLGNSVLSYIFWNRAIAKLGTATTALFGNLIPLFSAAEAVWFLGEKITALHIVSALLVITGLIIANISTRKKITVRT